MGDGKGLHPERAHVQACSRLYRADQVLQRRNAAAELPGCAGAGIDGQGKFFGKGGKSGDVVRVLVGDKDAGERLRGHTEGGQGGGDAAAGDARVYQNMGSLSAHQQAVAGGAAGYGSDLQKIAP